jgi:3-dehydroquinate synthase
MAFEFSAAQKLCTPEDATKVKSHFSKLGLTSINDVASLLGDPHKLLSHMDQDKKNEGGALTLILARAIGEAFVQKAAPRDAVLDYLQHLSQTTAQKTSETPHA